MRRNKFGKKSVLLTVILLIAIIGVGVTIAISVAQSNQVNNTFRPGKIDTSITEEVDEQLNKRVSVQNSREAKSDAFVRVRINAPTGVTLRLNDAMSGYWQDGGDGFYYYLYSVGPGEYTTELLNKIEITDTTLNEVDVTVYHEACIASQEHRKDVETEPLSVDVIKKAFEDATGTEHQQ